MTQESLSQDQLVEHLIYRAALAIEMRERAIKANQELQQEVQALKHQIAEQNRVLEEQRTAMIDPSKIQGTVPVPKDPTKDTPDKRIPRTPDAPRQSPPSRSEHAEPPTPWADTASK